MILMDINLKIANIFCSNNLPYDEDLALDLYVKFIAPDSTFSPKKIKWLVEKHLNYNVQDAILDIMKAVEDYEPTIDPLIKDSIVNIDLPDLETVILRLD